MLSGAPYASINAMAILVKMQYSFYNEDLQGVNLSQANLEGAMLFGTKLNGGNLEKTRMHNTCLHGADLREARMSQVDTGRKRSIITAREIKSWDLSPNEHFLAVADGAGVSIRDLEKDVIITYIKLMTVREKHLKNASIKVFYYIKYVKFIDDQRVLLLDTVGFLGLWSIVNSTFLCASPTILTLGDFYRFPVREITKIYGSPFSWPSSSLINFYCYKGSAILNKMVPMTLFAS